MAAPVNNAGVVPFTGDLKPMTLPWLMQCIRSQSKTGTATFEYVQDKTALAVVKKIYFRTGDVTFASSNLDEDRLGDMLLRAGKINQAQFDATAELLKRTGKKQGALLVELGFIRPQDLVDGVKEQVKQIILGLFGIRMGSYRFDEGPLPVADIVPLQMSTGNVILDAVGALAWESIRKAIPLPTTVMRPATDPSTLFQDANLSQDQRTVLALLDGKRSIEEACGMSGIGDFNCLKAIYVLLALRMAEIGSTKTEEDMAFARDAVREAVAARSEVEREPAEPPEPELVVTRELLQKAHADIATLTHYEVLGVPRDATPQKIKRAYFRLAKAYHPDRHFDPAMADLKGVLETLFDRVHKAYDVLSKPDARSAYDSRLGSAPAAARPKAAAGSDEFVEKHAEEYVENYAEKAARAAEQFGFGMKEFKIGNYWGAEEKFAWATRLDPLKAPYFFYYGLCLSNIPRRKHEAEEILQKAIELDQTKVEYHIELSNLYVKSGLKTKALGVLNAALERVSWTDKIQEAIVLAQEGKTSAVLLDQAKGEEKAAAGRPKAHRADKAKQAEALEKFNSALKDFKVNNFGTAVDGFGVAARLDPANAQYQYYYGICLARIPRRQTEAEEPLRKAFELDPSKMEHHFEIGNYYLKAGHKVKAIGILKNALLRFPDAQKIKDALKAAGATTEEQLAEEKKSGMFGKIFKK